MYRVRVYISPKGVEDIALQMSGKDKRSAQPMLFYLTLQKELDQFRSRVGKALSASVFTCKTEESRP